MPKNAHHGHVIPNPNGNLARCGGTAFCQTCKAELAELGLTLEEFDNARRAGLARVLAALLRVCASDYTAEDKQAVLCWQMFDLGMPKLPWIDTDSA